MDCASYSRKPVYSLQALGLMLGESPDLLEKLSCSSGRLYRQVPQKKKDGSVRETFDAFEPLKKIQRKIVDRLFVHVVYPKYLHGGIRDIRSPRSAFSNAEVHSGARVVLLQDVTNFFPSITIEEVKDIFVRFFCFGAQVSNVLALLVTKDGVVPQGASTSSYLANLVFWNSEPRLVAWIESLGLRYSRFADDITISSKVIIESDLRTEIVRRVTGMLAGKGFRQKRTKLHVLKKGQVITRGDKHDPVVITGLGVAGKSIGVIKAERSRIKAAVRQFELEIASGKAFAEVSHLYQSIMGRIGRMLACGQKAGIDLKNRLNEAKKRGQVPVLDRYRAKMDLE